MSEFISDREIARRVSNGERPVVTKVAMDRWQVNGKAAVSAWQPIETAPKDGSVILLRQSSKMLIGYVSAMRPKKEVAIGYFDQRWVFGVPGGRGEGGDFTHWAPLPEPPEATK